MLEGHGRSLVDLGAEYAEEFYEWFKRREPSIYEEWHAACVTEKAEADKLTTSINPDANLSILGEAGTPEDLLFDFTNNTLGGRVYDTCDQLLLEFAQANLKGALHFRYLLDQLK